MSHRWSLFSSTLVQVAAARVRRACLIFLVNTNQLLELHILDLFINSLIYLLKMKHNPGEGDMKGWKEGRKEGNGGETNQASVFSLGREATDTPINNVTLDQSALEPSIL